MAHKAQQVLMELKELWVKMVHKAQTD